jgi:hypothetical protein
MAAPEIQRIVEQHLIVRADIEAHRQRLRRMNAGRGGIQRELADRDADTAAPDRRCPEWIRSVATINRMRRPSAAWRKAAATPPCIACVIHTPRERRTRLKSRVA